VECNCDEGFEEAISLWNAIAMKASKGLHSSVECDCDEGFEGAFFPVDCNCDEGYNVATL